MSVNETSRKGESTSIKTFRLDKEELEIIEVWKKKLNVSETDVVRIALRLLPGNFRQSLNLLLLTVKLNELEVNDMMQMELLFQAMKSLLEVLRPGVPLPELDDIIKRFDEKIASYQREIEKMKRMLLTMGLSTGAMSSGAGGK